MLSEMAFLLALVTGSVASTTPINSAPQPSFTVTKCTLRYRPEARVARFAATVRYRIVTDGSGLVASVEEDTRSSRCTLASRRLHNAASAAPLGARLNASVRCTGKVGSEECVFT